MATLKNEKGHVLYHIQNMNVTADGEPFDVFVFGSERGLTEDDLRRIAEDEFGGDDMYAADKDAYQEYVKSQIEEFMSSSSIFTVWVDDIDDLV